MRAALHAAWAAALLACASFGATAQALPFVQTPVPDARLDTMRGGFFAAGLELSLGIERSTLVNGELVAHTRFVIPDLRQLDAVQARAVAEALSRTTLVQIGPGQHVDSGALAGLSGLGAVVIQNGLDGQQIRQTTVIDTATNSLGLLTSRLAAGTARDAFLQTLTPR